MIEKITILGNVKHVFTAENDFLMQPDWILQVKGPEAKQIWDEMSTEIEHHLIPEYIDLYEEWIDYYGITHTITNTDETPQ